MNKPSNSVTSYLDMAQLRDGHYPSLQFVKLRITNVCNLRCIKCNYWTSKRLLNQPHEMPTEMALQAIRDAAAMGCRRIKLTGGEVLTYSHIATLIRECSAHGIQSSITTNGTLLTRELADDLVEAGLSDITISLDSSTPEAQDHLCGVHGACAAALSGIIEALSSYRNAGQSVRHVNVALVIHRLSASSLTSTLRDLSTLGVGEVIIVPLIEHALPVESPLPLANLDEGRLLANIFAIGKELNLAIRTRYLSQDATKSSTTPERIYARIPCFVPWYQLYINTAGSISPCCYLKKAYIGDMQKSSLSDAFFSAAAWDFRSRCLPPIQRKKCLDCQHECQRNQQIALELGDDALSTYMCLKT